MYRQIDSTRLGDIISVRWATSDRPWRVGALKVIAIASLKTQKWGLQMYIARIAAALVPLLFMAGCAVQPLQPKISLPTPYTQGVLSITVDGLYRDGNGTVIGVSGIATNVAGQDLTSCTITFDVLDATGAKVSSAIAVTNGLKAAQNWRFQATFMNPFSVNFTSIVPGQTSWLPPMKIN